MSENTAELTSIAQAKAKLQEELPKLEEQEQAIQAAEASSAHASAISLLEQFASFFSVKQRDEIAARLGTASPQVSRKKKGNRGEVKPKYWLPHMQATWTGRGRTPKAFAAWEGTAAYNEWKKSHPDEKFPAYPG